jgi:hypothetical protein
MSAHADGTECPEGTQQVPESFRPCCERFGEGTKSCYADLRYEFWTQHGEAFWVIRCQDGSGVHIYFCPHCGRSLQEAYAGDVGSVSRHLFDLKAAAVDMIRAFKKTWYPEMSSAAAKLDKLSRDE